MKNRTRPLVIAWFLFGLSASATNLIWNGSPGGNRDTSTASWLAETTPTSWRNANPDSAIFDAIDAGAINLTIGITAGAITFNTGQPTPVRYIRIEMLKNSANQWMQLVKVIAK
jgi:hypothetical protein